MQTDFAFPLRTSISDWITVFLYRFISSFSFILSLSLCFDLLVSWSISPDPSVFPTCYCYSLRSVSICMLLFFFLDFIWDLIESGDDVDVNVFSFAGETVLFFFFFLIRSSISFWRFFFNWKVVWIVKLGINRSKEKWGWHSRSFSAGFSRRRKCEFWWLVLMLLVRPLSCTSSSSERSLPQFLPSVSF